MGQIQPYVLSLAAGLGIGVLSGLSAMLLLQRFSHQLTRAQRRTS